MRQAQAVGDVDGALGAEPLDFQPVVLNLDVEIVAEELVRTIRPTRVASSIWSLRMYSLNSLEAQPLQADDAFVVRGQQLLVDART